jgi:tripeptidyl-peptidase-1
VLGIVGFGGHYPSSVDLKAFMDKYRFGVDATFAVIPINYGGYGPSRPHEEANLDIRYAEAMASPTPHVFYSTGLGQWGKDDAYLSWLRYILNQ